MILKLNLRPNDSRPVALARSWGVLDDPSQPPCGATFLPGSPGVLGAVAVPRGPVQGRRAPPWGGLVKLASLERALLPCVVGKEEGTFQVVVS